MPSHGLVPAALVAVLLVGCATIDPDACARFEQDRQAVRYDTRYRYSEHDTRVAAANFKRLTTAPIAARWYTLRVNTADIRPCEHLYLYKELYLERAPAKVTIEEVRDFYTARGERIATKRENMTGQLKETGYYTASVPLPIPESAPPGRYRVVSRLVMKTNGRETRLATASAEFRVRR